MALIEFGSPRPRVDVAVRACSIRWPEQSAALLTVSITDVQLFRESMLKDKAAPKTINRRISSLSSFYICVNGFSGTTNSYLYTGCI
jgi:hypothetical protein